MQHRKFNNPEVQQTFNGFSKNVRVNLLILRDLIYEVAEESEEVGEINETLKWENPSYLTHAPKSGTTIRLSAAGTDDDQYAISVHCQTTLVSEFKEIYPELTYDGNRSIIIETGAELPIDTIRHFIYAALTYHYRRKHGIGI